MLRRSTLYGFASRNTSSSWLFANLDTEVNSLGWKSILPVGNETQGRYFRTSLPSQNLISGALEEVLAEEEVEDETEEDEDLQGQDYARGKRKNAKGSIWRYNRIVSEIRGKPLDDAFEILKQLRMHRKARVVQQMLWAARSAAEHNYSLDPNNLYIEKIWASKGSHLSGRIIIHGKGRRGFKTRPRTHLYVVVKEMPDKMKERILAWETREDLWRQHIEAKTQEFMERFPQVDLLLPQSKKYAYPHNEREMLNTHDPITSEKE